MHGDERKVAISLKLAAAQEVLTRKLVALSIEQKSTHCL
jgi:hypothetical protein